MQQQGDGAAGLLQRLTHRSGATVLWLAKRVVFLGVVVLTGWAIFELLVVPIIEDDDPALAFVVLWLVMAYLVLPRLQRLLTKIYVPDYFVGRARTNEGLLGDPVNLAVMGTEDALLRTMRDAGWTRADDLSFRTGFRLVRDTLVRRRYPAAPVNPCSCSPGGRTSPSSRRSSASRPAPPCASGSARRRACRAGCAWTGSAPAPTTAAWVSAFTLQITHKIGENTDLERDHVLQTMEQADGVTSVRWMQDYFSGYHARNGGGDAISTDGNLPVVRLREPAHPPGAGSGG
jgi:hypothetical protein